MRLARALGIIALVLMSSAPLRAAAQDTKLEMKSTDSVRTLLERQIGKRVSVVLTTGPELAGVVVSVGDKLVHLSELTGREFFDAVVNLEQVGAVIVRVRPR